MFQKNGGNEAGVAGYRRQKQIWTRFYGGPYYLDQEYDLWSNDLTTLQDTRFQYIIETGAVPDDYEYYEAVTQTAIDDKVAAELSAQEWTEPVGYVSSRHMLSACESRIKLKLVSLPTAYIKAWFLPVTIAFDRSTQISVTRGAVVSGEYSGVVNTIRCITEQEARDAWNNPDIPLFPDDNPNNPCPWGRTYLDPVYSDIVCELPAPDYPWAYGRWASVTTEPYLNYSYLPDYAADEWDDFLIPKKASGFPDPAAEALP